MPPVVTRCVLAAGVLATLGLGVSHRALGKTAEAQDAEARAALLRTLR
jgi:hypothetical protein